MAFGAQSMWQGGGAGGWVWVWACDFSLGVVKLSELVGFRISFGRRRVWNLGLQHLSVWKYQICLGSGVSA